MKLHLACECGRKLAVDETLLGKKVRCPACRLVFVASAPDSAPAATFAVLSEEQAPPPKPAPARRRSEEDEPEESPRRRRRREGDETPVQRQSVASGGSSWYTDGMLDQFLFVVGFVVLILSGVGIYMGIQKLRLAATASDTPQTLTLAQLIAKGPGDNAHVLVTDCVPAMNYAFSYQKGKYESVSKDQAENRNWTAVYVPLVPLTPDMKFRRANHQDIRAALEPSAVRVIVIPNCAKNKASTDSWCDNTTRVQGMVVNLITSLDSQTEKLLKERYPGTDFSRCWIIREGETPARAGTQLAIITASTAGVILGVLYFLIRFLKRRQLTR